MVFPLLVQSGAGLAQVLFIPRKNMMAVPSPRGEGQDEGGQLANKKTRRLSSARFALQNSV
jgi:hypothetical protein